jgi:hypothetical protein
VGSDGAGNGAGEQLTLDFGDSRGRRRDSLLGAYCLVSAAGNERGGIALSWIWKWRSSACVSAFPSQTLPGANSSVVSTGH